MSSKTLRHGTQTVRAHYKKDGSDHFVHDGDSTMLEVKTFEGPHATVSVNLAATIATRQYENVKVGVFLSLHCYPEEVDDAFATAWLLAEAQLEKHVEEVVEMAARK